MKQLPAKTSSPPATSQRASTRPISIGTSGMISSCGRPVQAITSPICCES